MGAIEMIDTVLSAGKHCAVPGEVRLSHGSFCPPPPTHTHVQDNFPWSSYQLAQPVTSTGTLKQNLGKAYIASQLMSALCWR